MSFIGRIKWLILLELGHTIYIQLDNIGWKWRVIIESLMHSPFDDVISRNPIKSFSSLTIVTRPFQQLFSTIICESPTKLNMSNLSSYACSWKNWTLKAIKIEIEFWGVWRLTLIQHHSVHCIVIVLCMKM